MNPEETAKVKLLCGILYTHQDLLNKALELLGSEFGEIDFRSKPFEFGVSDYYYEEMGEDIRRIFVSFAGLICPGDLADIKIKTNTLEDQLRLQGHRKVNIDSGYLDYDKVVLASAKYNGDKIYLARGIWGDLTLRYKKGRYLPYPWSFPDFKTGKYNQVFMEIRRRYKKSLKPRIRE